MPPMMSARASGRWALLELCGLLLLASLVGPADAARLVSYNLLNYPNSIGDSREDDFRLVLAQLDPDLVVAQEIESATGAFEFQRDVLDVVWPAQWGRATFVDNGGDSGNCLYFRSSDWELLAQGTLSTTPRVIDWWQLRPSGYASAAADLYVYGAHLKASSGATEAEQRRQQAVAIRDHAQLLPAGSHFLLAGDLNLYGSTEPAWAELTGVQINNHGRFFDPISTAGEWNNNSAYRFVHSQSTRTTNLGDGGSTGGMDDRFDFVLMNDDLLDADSYAFVSGSYVTYGQDGEHFNSAVNAAPTNTAVGQAIANALYAASDHLPVVVDLQLPATINISGGLDFGPVLLGHVASRALSIDNPADAPADELNVVAAVAAPFSFQPSELSVEASTSSATNLWLDTSTPGVFELTAVISSNSIDEPLILLPASATVLNPSSPSLDPSIAVTSGDVDFGAHPQGEFLPQSVAIYNLGYSSLHAALQVYDVVISGPDASRFNLTESLPMLVAAQAVSLEIGFNDTGAAESQTYSAVLTLRTRDDPGVLGARPRPDLLLAVEAFVQSDVVAAPTSPVVTRLYPNLPNPFNPTTVLRFDLAVAGPVSLWIYDVRGRVVRRLVDEELQPGRHARSWDGRDDDGYALASGVYFYRLHAGDEIYTRRMTLVR